MAQLQKKDLAKEFSQLVQQEIKNHNDLLLSNNMAMQEMRGQISELRLQGERRSEIVRADFNAQADSIDILKECTSRALEKMQREINDSVSFNEDGIISLRKSMEARETYFLTVQGFEEFKEKIDQWIANIQRAFNQQRDFFSQEFRKIMDTNQASIDCVRKAIELSITKETDERKQYDKTFDIYAVSFETSKREIEVLKKRCFIIEKNIENLYTQISRLKGET